jgi:hypothetical protein
MPTIMLPVIASLHVEHRAGTNHSFKNFIRISALEVLAAPFDFIGPPISEIHPLLRIALDSLVN